MPLAPPQGQPGLVGASAAQPGAAKLRKEKDRQDRRREAHRRQEEKERREREARMRERILEAVRARVLPGHGVGAGGDWGGEDAYDDDRAGMELLEGEEMEVEEEAVAAGGGGFGRIDLLGVGRGHQLGLLWAGAARGRARAGGSGAGPAPAVRRLLAELLSTPAEGPEREEAGEVGVLEKQMASVPSASVSAAAGSKGEEDDDGGASSGSSIGSEDDGGRGPQGDGGESDVSGPSEDEKDDEEKLHLRLHARVIDPPAWDPCADWEAGVPAYAFPGVPLVHLTLLADDAPALWTLPPPPKPEEEMDEEDEPPPTPRGGHSRRRSPRLQHSQADGGSVAARGRPAVVVEVDGRRRWVVPEIEPDEGLEELDTDGRARKRRRVWGVAEAGAGGGNGGGKVKEEGRNGPVLRPGDCALPLVRLRGLDVQLVVPASASASAAAGRLDAGEVDLLGLVRQARLWGKGLLEAGRDDGERFHERMARTYYAWLHPLVSRPGLVPVGGGGVLPPLLVTPEAGREELRGYGRVRVLHLVAPVGCAELWVGGKRVKHPAFLQRGRGHGGRK